MSPRGSPRRKAAKRDYSRRGVYTDYLHRWAWSVDSLGRKSPPIRIPDEDERRVVETELQRMLDHDDPIRDGDFVPASIGRMRLLS